MDWTNLIVGSILGFLLSIVANIYTDKYKDWSAQRTIVNKNKRISELKKDLERFTKFRQNPTKFYLSLVRRLFFVLLNIQGLILITFIILVSPTARNIDTFMKDIIPFWPVTSEQTHILLQQLKLMGLFLIVPIIYYTYRSTINDINNFVDYENFEKAMNERIEKLAQ